MSSEQIYEIVGRVPPDAWPLKCRWSAQDKWFERPCFNMGGAPEHEPLEDDECELMFEASMFRWLLSNFAHVSARVCDMQPHLHQVVVCAVYSARARTRLEAMAMVCEIMAEHLSLRD